MRSVHPTADHEQVKIGAKLRSARVAQQLTLEQLAQASNLSRSFISRIENDTTSPSIATLVQLCQVLSLPVGNLFTQPEIQLTHLDTAPLINMGGQGVTERLVTARSEARVQVIHTNAEPHANGGAELYTVSSEIEVVHIISGTVSMEFNSHSVRLDAGDTLTFSGREPHNWRAYEEGATLTWTLIPAAWSGSA